MPSKLLPVNYSKEIEYTLNSFNTIDKIILYTIDSISFMFITETSNIDSSIFLKYSEKIDILIISNTSTETSNRYRATLRPRFCITTADPADIHQIRNYLHINSQCSTLELAIDNKKRIKSVQKVCK